MNCYRFALFIAMLLFSSPNVASAFGYLNLAAHGQDFDSDTPTKRLLRDSATKEGHDEERLNLAKLKRLFESKAKKKLRERQKELDKLKENEETPAEFFLKLRQSLTKHFDGSKYPEKNVVEYFESARFEHWFNIVTEASGNLVYPHIKVLEHDFGARGLSCLIYIAAHSKSPIARKYAKILEAEQFETWSRQEPAMSKFLADTKFRTSGEVQQQVWNNYKAYYDEVYSRRGSPVESSQHTSTP